MSKWSPLLSFNKAYASKGKELAIQAPATKQLKLHQIKATNRSGGSIDLGLFVKTDSGHLSFGQVDDSATPDFIDKLSTILAGTAVDIFTTTANDGFLVQSDKPFGLIGLSVSQAQSGGPTYEYSYYNGTAFVAFTPIFSPVSYTVADHLIVFLQPVDWVAGTTAAVGGSSDKYTIRVRATTAPGQAVKATALWVAQMLEFAEAVADNGTLSVTFDQHLPLELESLEGIIPYFATAAAGNMVSGYYQISD